MEKLKPNDQRRLDNLNHAHGIYINGVYFDHGIPQISKEKYFKLRNKGKKLPSIWGLLFERKK